MRAVRACERARVPGGRSVGRLLGGAHRLRQQQREARLEAGDAQRARAPRLPARDAAARRELRAQRHQRVRLAATLHIAHLRLRRARGLGERRLERLELLRGRRGDDLLGDLRRDGAAALPLAVGAAVGALCAPPGRRPAVASLLCARVRARACIGARAGGSLSVPACARTHAPALSRAHAMRARVCVCASACARARVCARMCSPVWRWPPPLLPPRSHRALRVSRAPRRCVLRARRPPQRAARAGWCAPPRARAQRAAARAACSPPTAAPARTGWAARRPPPPARGARSGPPRRTPRRHRRRGSLPPRPRRRGRPRPRRPRGTLPAAPVPSRAAAWRRCARLRRPQRPRARPRPRRRRAP